MNLLIAIWIVTAGAGALSNPALTIEVTYREPADAFEILDNASNWWPGYTEPEYSEYWADSLGISATDSIYFGRYKSVREKYFDRTGQNDEDPRVSRSGLFTDHSILNSDPVAQAFYSAETLEGAFRRLGRVMEPDDLVVLRSCFEHFSEQLGQLTAETEQMVLSSVKQTRQAIDNTEVTSYLGDVRSFIGVVDTVRFTALYVWWPDSERIRANPNGPFLLLRVRPHEGETINSADVVAHEAVHVFVAMKSDDEKRAMSDAILSACPDVLNYTRRLGVLEESIATILGNIEFRRRFDPSRFAWSREWYGEQWVDLLARLLYPVAMDAIAAGQSMDGGFTEDAIAQIRITMDALQTREVQR